MCFSSGECSQEPATVSAVQVFYIDFGNSEECALEALRPLPEQFARLPAHAIPCALAEVTKPILSPYTA